MQLEQVLQSPQIEVHSIEEFEREYPPKREVINQERYSEILNLANEAGILELFRKQ